MQKESAVALFNVLSRHLSGEQSKTTKTCQEKGLWSRICTQDLPRMK